MDADGPGDDAGIAGRATELRAEAIVKSFGDNRVLRGVGLEVERGGLVAIVGGSGCGKTVLLEVLTAQMAPDSGRVLVANHERPAPPSSTSPNSTRTR